jgi:hypothetical protein
MFEIGVSNTMIATRGLEEALVARSGPCPLPPDAWRRFLWYYDESIHLEHAIRHGQIYPNKSDLLYFAFIRFDTQIAASTTRSSKPRDALRQMPAKVAPPKAIIGTISRRIGDAVYQKCLVYGCLLHGDLRIRSVPA